jgi:arylsulfatase A-like enzyme
MSLNWIKYSFILVLLLVVSLLNSCNSNRENNSQQKQPNILLLLADDLGYGELGCYGQEMIETPVLDGLAQKGMHFTDFYAGNAVCSPSRAVLMTGKSSSYNTIRGNTGYFGDDRWMRVALKKEETTMAEMLREAGYQTGFIGKWHLGDPNDILTWAYHRGFDYAVQEQWGSRNGGGKFDEQMQWINGMQDSIYYHIDEWECKDDFRTKLAFDYLDNIDKGKPFFLFMSYRAPHGHERVIGNNTLYQDMDWSEAERLHASKITLLDKQIGRLLVKLEEMGKLDNTLVLFTSDNGPHKEGDSGHNPDFFDSSGGLRGIKRDLYEGGIRVPLIAYWKGRIQAGTISNHISGFQDLMPTISEVAGVESPEASNGLSILPEFLGGEPRQHEFLNWEFQMVGGSRRMPDLGFRQSARVGNWKVVRYGIHSSTELYNLDTDIQEENNLALQYPEIVKEMEKLFKNRTYSGNYPEGGVIPD